MIFFFFTFGLKASDSIRIPEKRSLDSYLLLQFSEIIMLIRLPCVLDLSSENCGICVEF